MSNFVTEGDIFTFEDALKRFKDAGEEFGHLSPVVLTYYKGGFILTFQKDERTNNERG